MSEKILLPLSFSCLSSDGSSLVQQGQYTQNQKAAELFRLKNSAYFNSELSNLSLAREKL